MLKILLGKIFSVQTGVIILVIIGLVLLLALLGFIVMSLHNDSNILTQKKDLGIKTASGRKLILIMYAKAAAILIIHFIFFKGLKKIRAEAYELKAKIIAEKEAKKSAA